MKRANLPIYLLAFGISGFLYSCDNSYDLSKDIDTEITVGSNFKIPVGKTEKILLSRIIKPSETIYENSQGIYEITANGDFNSSVNVINPVSVKGLDPILHDVTIPIEIKKSSVTRATDYIFTADLVNTANYDVNEKMPAEVKDISYVEFTSNNQSPVRTKMEINIAGIPSGIEQVTIKGMKIEFPEIFLIEGQATSTINVPDFILSNQSKNHIIDIQIEGMSIPKGSKYVQTIGNSVHLVINSDLKVTAQIEAPVDIKQVTLGDAIRFQFKYSVPNLEIDKVAGTLVPNVKIEQTLKLNDIPDFIKGEDCNFGINDISMAFTITNPIQMPISTDIVITPWNDEKNTSDGPSVTVPLKNISPAAKTNFNITNTTKPIDGARNIVVPELNTLLSKVPDSYKIESKTVTAESTSKDQYIALGKGYTLNGDYNIAVPFSFSNLDIVYEDEIDNLLSDLKDVADKTTKIIVTAQGLTTIPTQLEASVKMLGANGEELKGIEVQLNKFIIAPSTDGNEKSSDIEIVLIEKEGSNDLELLDKIKYTIKATSTQGQSNIVLKPSQYIIIQKIVANIPNGINVDI